MQRQVLAFYRTVLRQTRKQSATQRGPIAAYARGEFERYAPLPSRCTYLDNVIAFCSHPESLSEHVSLLLHRHRDVNPKDYQLIEVRLASDASSAEECASECAMMCQKLSHWIVQHLVRKGKRQLDMLEQSSVTGVQFREGH